MKMPTQSPMPIKTDEEDEAPYIVPYRSNKASFRANKQRRTRK